MRIHRGIALLVLFLVSFGSRALCDDAPYDTVPPFGLDLLKPARNLGNPTGERIENFNPRSSYAIAVNYELGMHCVSFDISYCCIIPPYNSIQAQAVRCGTEGATPRLLAPGDGVRLYYGFRDNSYSEGNKMKYWQIAKDVSGRGTMDSPNDNMPNYVWSHLFIFKDLYGTLPENPELAKRLYVGKDLPVNIDSGPSGKPLSGGYLDYAPAKGGNIVFTDSLLPALKNVPITLTSSYLWDALGLPLTAFHDSTRKGSIRTISDLDFQPFQYATVQLRDARGEQVLADGRAVEFFGTEPIDIANCSVCHAGGGIAASLGRGGGLRLFDQEYAYWRTHYPDESDYMARLASASIMVLELHDQRHKTKFLRDYDPQAASNRLGRNGPVNCVDCHGDNMSGNLQIPRPGTTGYRGVKARPLTEAIHAVHARLVRMPDGAGRTQNCQACHPSHWQSRAMNDLRKNPYHITDDLGNPRFSSQDLRVSGGGCYLRRDAHANPAVIPPFFLNDIGRWYLNEVSLKDEKGKRVGTLRGLYCTNCHNHLSHELYRYDDLGDATAQEGKTYRNRPVAEVIGALAGGDLERFRSYFADPRVGAPGEPLYNYYANRKETVLARTVPGKGGRAELLPWNAATGEPVSYPAVSGGGDWWLSPGVPHCADCHAAPFVESAGGQYFPIDQPGKYSLYRYSKAHGALACQSCHQSMHGLYPVRENGAGDTVDATTHQQALQFSPDGSYAGPLTCAACHTVNRKGVPVELADTGYREDYWASVALIHFMREADRKLAVPELVRKYPFARAQAVVVKGWK
jgi:mono/diheme cytochrome c family protein